MNTSELGNWNGFLPKRAIVMARNQQSAIASPEAPPLAASPLASQAQDTEAPTDVTKAQLVVPPPQTLDQIAAQLSGCQRCKLCRGRQNIVFGEGTPKAELVFVGEGPGEQEDIQGRPFVGKAGQLLDRMIQAIGLERNQVYIGNVVKCRPPGNRNPEPDEIEACSPFLYQQLDLIRPKIIVALGKFAAQTLLQREIRITQLRGKFQTYRGAKLMPTYHPSYLLRNPASKREAWIDLQLVAKELGLALPPRSN